MQAAIATADPSLLDEDEDAHCVKGCYRCLLSYYNQPDHEEIDRTNNTVQTILLRLARSKVAAETSSQESEPPKITGMRPSSDGACLFPIPNP